MSYKEKEFDIINPSNKANRFCYCQSHTMPFVSNKALFNFVIGYIMSKSKTTNNWKQRFNDI